MISGETWLRIVCECKVTNFVRIGYFPDSGDSSRRDVEGYKCWNCKKEFCFDSEMDEFAKQHPDVEMVHIRDGKPMTVFWCTH